MKTQVPILAGIVTDEGPDFRAKYPRNMVPVVMSTGISEGYLRPADGIVHRGTGPGVARGGIEWEGVIYEVMGREFVSVAADGTVTVIGNVGGVGRVKMAYSFDYLAIVSDGKLFLYDGSALTQSADPDLGQVFDVVWIDGYFMTTDGEFLVVNELNDPFEVNPTKYGSSEANPDPIVGLNRLRNEVYALNRYTVEAFSNIGGAGFPFTRISGAQIQRGCIGPHAHTVFQEALAFIGSGRNEAMSVWVGINGGSAKIATREVDTILEGYTEAELAGAYLESRTHRGHLHLHMLLPRHTLVYDGAASAVLQRPVWFELSSSLAGGDPWRVINTIKAYDGWWVFDTQTGAIGTLDVNVSSHWGEVVGWEFVTPIIYNESMGAIINEIELVALTGRTALGDDPTISTRYSLDGRQYSTRKTIKAGKIGERTKRLSWRQQGKLETQRVQSFEGTSDAHISFSQLQVDLEGLAW